MQKSLFEALISLSAAIVKDTEGIDTAACLAGLGYPSSPALADTFEKLVKKFCREPSAIEHFPVIINDFLKAPHAEGALLNLLRYAEIAAMPNVLLITLAEAGPLREVLATTFGSSQYMADIIIRNPGYLYWLIEQRTWDLEDSSDSFETELEREISFFHTREGRLNAIRRFHRKALLRIGVQDLLGLRSIETTTERLSNLADAIIRSLLNILWREKLGKQSKAVPAGAEDAIPEPGSGFAVIALGKLGGRELNYSSDIDLIYLCRDGGDTVTSFFRILAQSLTEALSEVTAEGYLYRTDLRLRPDGKSGPLVNTITSMRIYYENRGKPWEFQAMLKARGVAGDAQLANTFINNISKLIFNPSLSYSPVKDIGQMRKRIQENIPLRDRPFNIKLMEGGIRDIEFIIQTIQLLHIPQHPEIRAPGTLGALDAIQKRQLLDRAECDSLRDAYHFLRLVEHRLQMMHQIKTHSVPESQAEVALLAARVSKGPLGSFTYDEFIGALTAHLNNVRILSERFFSDSPGDRDSLLFFLPERSAEAKKALEKFGFTDVDSAVKIIHTMAYGSFPRLFDRSTRIAFADLLPQLLDQISPTGDPGLTLANLSRISAAGKSERAFYRLLHESERARALTVAVAGISSRLTGDLCTRPEILDALLAEPRGVIQQALAYKPEWKKIRGADGSARSITQGDVNSLRPKLRQVLDHLHLASFLVDILDESLPVTLADSRAALARHWIRGAMDGVFAGSGDSALFTLGSFAVGEPRLTSDIDLLFITSVEDTERSTRNIFVLNKAVSESGLFKLDFRLRGEGANAPLVQTIGFYDKYFKNRMSLWERVAFSKYACWWGCERIAGSFAEIVLEALARPFSREEIASLVQMRKQLELLAAGKTEAWETKRSAGGRYDIEYLCAIGLAQIAGRDDYPFDATTEERIGLLEQAGLLEAEETKSLIEAIKLYTRVEYLLELQGLSLPRSGERDVYFANYAGRSLAYLGFPVEGGAKRSLATAKQTTRRIFDRFISKLA